MKNFCSRFAVASVALLPMAAFAQATLFTDQASFLDAAGAGVYSDNFSTVPLSFPTATPDPIFNPVSSYSFSGGSDLSANPFVGTITGTVTLPDPSVGDLLHVPNGLTTNNDGYALSYALSSGNVRAIGGVFGITDLNGDFVAGTLEFHLSDGTLLDVTVGTEPVFQGFLLADGDTITSLDAFPLGSTGDAPLFATNPQLFVGVPETSTYAAAGFMGLAVGGLWLRRSRKAA